MTNRFALLGAAAGLLLATLIAPAAASAATTSAATTGASTAGAAETTSMAGAAGTTSTAGAPAAAPAAAPSGCPAQYACFWKNANFNDGPGKVKGDNEDFRALAHGSCPSGTWNDCISSIYNNGRSCTVFFFKDINYRGEKHSLGLGDSVSDISRWVSGFNDQISSNRWCS